MRARLDVEGLVLARERLDDVGDRARRPEPALRSPRAKLALQRSQQRTFATGRFTKNSLEWERRKRRKGLSRKRMQASGRLRSALVNAVHGVVKFTVFNGTLTWGLIGGRTDVYYARIWADRDKKRRVVKIDRKARVDIAGAISAYVSNGVIT